MNDQEVEEYLEYLKGNRGIVVREDDNVQVVRYLGRDGPHIQHNLKISLPALAPYLNETPKKVAPKKAE